MTTKEIDTIYDIYNKLLDLKNDMENKKIDLEEATYMLFRINNHLLNYLIYRE